ncbi:MAG: hypothetical protein JNL19_13090 [Burkholderiales bacterium]|nr:hypothetical protein [Burkholderiales bacterium]
MAAPEHEDPAASSRATRNIAGVAAFLLIVASVALLIRWVWIEQLILAIFATAVLLSGGMYFLPLKHPAAHLASVAIMFGWIAGTALWLIS